MQKMNKISKPRTKVRNGQVGYHTADIVWASSKEEHEVKGGYFSQKHVQESREEKHTSQ